MTGPLRIFGYGSLVWRPAIPHLERRPAWVSGWARRFFQGSTDHRGVPGAPGRVVTLLADPAARTGGVVYEVAPADVAAVLARLDVREQGGYERVRVRAELAGGGEPVEALTYVATPRNASYLGPADERAIARQIARCRGPSGTNREYLVALSQALRALGLPDPHVFAVERALAELRGASEESSKVSREQDSKPDLYPQIPYRPPRLPPDEMRARARAFEASMAARRSVRSFSPDPVPRELIEAAIRTASTAPSGAHRQPWRFVAVSSPRLKRAIREAAEAEERETYARRMSDEWRAALRPLGTDARKPYLEIAPWLVVAFEERYALGADGRAIKNYYVKESVGLACGLFVAAIQSMGLCTLTHTPSPMGFLSKILGRPDNERPFILFPVGYAADDATVPELERKPLDEVAIFDPEVEGC